MSSDELKGIMPALITPFTSDGKTVDFAALDTHIDRLISFGVHGLVSCGSTAEFTTLSMDERKAVLEQSIKSAAGRVPIIAGTGALCTDDIIDLSRHAAEVGAAAVLVVPPYYDTITYAQLYQLMAEVCEEARLPVVYYNIPSASGVTLTAEQIQGLSGVGVKYVKDTSGHGPLLTELLFANQDGILTFNGWDSLTFYALAAGARGAVWGAVNIIPELAIQLWNVLVVEGNLQKGRELWTQVFPICKFLESRHYSSAVKAGMELRGWSAGGLRKPFGVLAGEDVQKLAALLRAAGIQLSS